jgi:hypothetical protein
VTRPPLWRPGPPPRPTSTTHGASPGYCGRCGKTRPATRSALLDRDPAAEARLKDPAAAAELLRQLRAAGADDAAAALATRAAAEADLAARGGPSAVAELLRALREAGADDALHTLLDRDPAAEADLAARGDPSAFAEHVSEPSEAVHTVAREAAEGVAQLLRALREAGADDAAAALATRAAAEADLDDTWGVATLLRALREAGADDAVHALATRAAAGGRPGDLHAAAHLLYEMRNAGADDAVRTLLDRDPFIHALIGYNTPYVRELLEALREAGADETVSALTARAANAGMFQLFREFCPDEASSYPFGREPDGTPSRSLNWQELLTSNNRGL